jgi:hypothetical protein
MALKFWPYEEVEFELKDPSRGGFLIRTPWVISEIEIQPGSRSYRAVESYLSQGAETVIRDNVLAEAMSSTMEALQSLPIAYQLPRKSGGFGSDEHRVSRPLDDSSPRVMAGSLSIADVSVFEAGWSWDEQASLELSAIPGRGHDPLTLLSVARRFHYLDCSDNQMERVYDRVKRLPDPARRDRASALIVRQNHYVTEKCESSLQPACALAWSARAELEKFIQAEKGHDKLLAGSMRALVASPDELGPTPSAQALMAMLEACASTNFLGFCMALDFFEKPQFRDEDALAEMLRSMGKTEAAKALDIHKNINDSGEHETFSAALLAHMKPVDQAYAAQALRMAELVSSAIARIPYDLEERI